MTLQELIVKISADTTGLASGLDTATSKLDSLASSAGKVGVILTASLTAPIVALGTVAVRSAADMDALFRGLVSVAGSAKEAGIQFERLKEVAKLPGLGFRDAVQGSINLQAAGFSAGIAERALKAFGNALATVGKGKAELDGVIIALTQIAAKGKVSAEEINQLQERLPQIRKAMKEAFGTADTEALKKMGIDSETFIKKIIEQFEKLPKVTGGLKNDLENMADAWDQTLSKLGKAIAPAVSAALDAAGPLVTAVGTMAEGFTALPGPVQTASIALLAFVAAAGPVALAVSGIAKTFAVVIPLLGSAGLAGAISNVTFAVGTGLTGALTLGETLLLRLGQAALVAAAAFAGWKVGSFLYDNIKAVRAFGDAVADLILKIPGVQALINALSGAGSAQARASADLDFATKKLEESLKNKGILVNRAGLSTAQYSDALRKAAQASGFFAQQTAKTGGSVKATAADMDAANKAAERRLDAWEAMDKRYQKQAEDLIRVSREIQDNPLKFFTFEDARPFLQAKAQLVEMEAAFKAAHDSMAKKAGETVEIIIPLYQRLGKELFDALTTAGINNLPSASAQTGIDVAKLGDPIKALEDSYRLLGVTTQDELEEMARNAEDAYRRVAAAAGDTSIQAQQAWVKSIEAQINAHQKLPASVIADYITMQEALKSPAQKMLEFGREIDRETRKIFDGMAKAISQDLINGFSQGLDAVKKIGTDFATGLLNIFVRTLFKPLEDKLAALATRLGAKLMDALGLFGGSAASVASGAAGGAASAAGGAASAAGGVASGVGGAASGAAGSASSLLGSVANIANIANAGISLVSGIVSGVQMAHMNTALGRIEENTRYLQINFKNTMDAVWYKYVPKIEDINQAIYAHIMPALAEINDSIQSVVSAVRGGLSGGTTEGGVESAGSVVSAILDGAHSVVEALGTQVDRIVSAVTGITVSATPAAGPAPEPTSTTTAAPQDYSGGQVFTPASAMPVTITAEQANNMAVIQSLSGLADVVVQQFDRLISFLQGVKGAVSDAAGATAQVMGDVVDSVTGSVTSAADAVTGAVAGLADTSASVLGGLTDTVLATADRVAEIVAPSIPGAMWETPLTAPVITAPASSGPYLQGLRNLTAAELASLMRGGTQINVTDNVFRSREDADYLVQLIQERL